MVILMIRSEQGLREIMVTIQGNKAALSKTEVHMRIKEACREAINSTIKGEHNHSTIDLIKVTILKILLVSKTESPTICIE